MKKLLIAMSAGLLTLSAASAFAEDTVDLTNASKCLCILDGSAPPSCQKSGSGRPVYSIILDDECVGPSSTYNTIGPNKSGGAWINKCPSINKVTLAFDGPNLNSDNPVDEKPTDYAAVTIIAKGEPFPILIPLKFTDKISGKKYTFHPGTCQLTPTQQ